MGSSLLIDRLPDHLRGRVPDAAPPYFIGGTPPRVWWLVLTLSALLLIAAAAGIHPLFGLGLLLFARKKIWQAPVTLVADRTALHLLDGTPDGAPAGIPWTEIHPDIGIERVATGHGTSPALVIRVDAKSAYWAPATESRHMSRLLQPADGDGYRRLPLTHIGGRLEDALEALQQLRTGPEGRCPAKS